MYPNQRSKRAHAFTTQVSSSSFNYTERLGRNTSYTACRWKRFTDATRTDRQFPSTAPSSPDLRQHAVLATSLSRAGCLVLRPWVSSICSPVQAYLLRRDIMPESNGDCCRRRTPPLLPVLLLLLCSSLPCRGATISVSPGGDALQVRQTHCCNSSWVQKEPGRGLAGVEWISRSYFFFASIRFCL